MTTTTTLLPTTRREFKHLGWDKPDIILVTGDSYIDSPYIGVALIGRVLTEAGFKVGVIAQPDVMAQDDITRLGEPRLFWGVSGGSVDSMVANYTATRRKRRSDDFTPGGKNNRRPDRAVIVYSNLIRRFFKQTVPIVLGGVEASLRRIAHYDFWSDSLRKSILFDAKADYLVYGMGEKATVEIACSLRADKKPTEVRGVCYVGAEPPTGYAELPSYDEVVADKNTFIQMFKTFYHNNDPISSTGLCQRQDNRYLVQNRPAESLDSSELDNIHELPFSGEVHPFYARQGSVKALETIRFSLTTHRGCYGECNFCSITAHQGRTVQWRTQKSILAEAERMTRHPEFKGIIQDVGGPTANMYGFECERKLTEGACAHKRCLTPRRCKEMKLDHSVQTNLLTRLRKLPGVKKVFVASGIRYDMILDDRIHGLAYIKELVGHHVSGQMKIAPEHTNDAVLKMMGKPSSRSLEEFTDLFKDLSKKANKKQFLTYYLIAAHPGCTADDMQALKTFTHKRLKLNPEQVQIFTPLPSTFSALMYYTGINPFTDKELFVERDTARKEKQKRIVTDKSAATVAKSKTDVPTKTTKAAKPGKRTKPNKHTKSKAKSDRTSTDQHVSARKRKRPRSKPKRKK
jgi:uncharacterized radical SAM protein YgiQ